MKYEIEMFNGDTAECADVMACFTAVGAMLEDNGYVGGVRRALMLGMQYESLKNVLQQHVREVTTAAQQRTVETDLAEDR